MTNFASNVLRGSQEPTNQHYPPYTSTSGDEAISFAHAIGMKPDEWQCNLLRHILGEVQDPLNPDGLVWAAQTVGCVVPRQNGKTFLLDLIIIVGLFLFGERIVLTAQDRDTAKAAFLRIVSIIESEEYAGTLGPEVTYINRNNGNEQIHTKIGGLFRVKARNANAGRGLQAIDRLIMDEAYDVTDEDLAAIMPIVAASPNPQVMFFSTPPLNAVTGEPFTKLRQRGEAKDPTVAWFSWGIDPEKLDTEVDLDDKRVWARVNPSFNIRLRETTMAGFRASLSDEAFAREHLGVWPKKYANTVIDLMKWRLLAEENLALPDPVTIAVDATGSGNRAWATIVAYGVTDDGIGIYEVIDNAQGLKWVVPRLIQLRDDHKPLAVALDPVGPIGTILVDIEKAGFVTPTRTSEPEFGDLAIPTVRQFAAACGQFVESITNSTVRHPDVDCLNVAVTSVKTRKLGDDSWAWERFKSDVDVSPVVAASLAQWAYNARAHLVTNNGPDPQFFTF